MSAHFVMRISLIFFVIALSAKSCRVISGFQVADIEESAELSGAVLVGTVRNENPNQFPFDRDVTLVDATYYKGCGPKTVDIVGYSSSSMCGVSAPVDGTRVIAFVCKDSREARWKIHDFAAWSGHFAATDENLANLRELYSVNICSSDQFVSLGCNKRTPTKFIRRRPERELPSLVRFTVGSSENESSDDQKSALDLEKELLNENPSNFF